jgi:hypothetical protein
LWIVELMPEETISWSAAGGRARAQTTAPEFERASMAHRKAHASPGCPSFERWTNKRHDAKTITPMIRTSARRAHA